MVYDIFCGWCIMFCYSGFRRFFNNLNIKQQEDVMILFRRYEINLPLGMKTIIWVIGLLVALFLMNSGVRYADILLCAFPASVLYAFIKWRWCEGMPSIHCDANCVPHEWWGIDWKTHRSPYMPPLKIEHRFIMNRHYIGDFELKFRYKLISGMVSVIIGVIIYFVMSLSKGGVDMDFSWINFFLSMLSFLALAVLIFCIVFISTVDTFGAEVAIFNCALPVVKRIIRKGGLAVAMIVSIFVGFFYYHLSEFIERIMR